MVRLVCKHFGLSSQYINEEMPVLPDWYCHLSVAVDAEEDEWYNQQYLAYMSAGGDLKKFPKRKRRYTEIAQTTRREPLPQENPADLVLGALGQSGVNMVGRKGSAKEYAEARGLDRAYQMPDGTFTDKDGNPVEPKPGSVFVKIDGA